MNAESDDDLRRIEVAASGHRATPMIAQYQTLKSEHPECLLFFRMGDFYELFFEDAKQAAPALDIALTKRGRHGDEDIPMCGVPVHSAEGYLERLIKKGIQSRHLRADRGPGAGQKSVARNQWFGVKSSAWSHPAR